MMNFGLGCVCWGLWVTRNKMAIEKKLIKTPSEIIFKSLSFAQQWSVALREEDQVMVRSATERLRRKAHEVRRRARDERVT